jgi:hypothetical protein
MGRFETGSGIHAFYCNLVVFAELYVTKNLTIPDTIQEGAGSK